MVGAFEEHTVNLPLKNTRRTNPVINKDDLNKHHRMKKHKKALHF